MNRWTRRAITYGIMFVAMSVLYTQLKGDGWSSRDLLLCFGSIAIVASLGGFFIKPSKKTERYSEMLGTPATSRSRVIQSSIWFASGLAIVSAAFFIAH